MDPIVIAGYLALALSGAAKRFADKRIDNLVEAMYQRVKDKVGAGDPMLQTLKAQPESDEARLQAAYVIDQAAKQDRNFADQLAKLQQSLDQLGGRRYFGEDIDPGDPPWVKIAYVGALLFGLAGFVTFMYAVFTLDMEPGAPWPPPLVVRAFLLFIVGAVLTVIAKAGHMFNDPYRRR